MKRLLKNESNLSNSRFSAHTLDDYHFYYMHIQYYSQLTVNIFFYKFKSLHYTGQISTIFTIKYERFLEDQIYPFKIKISKMITISIYAHNTIHNLN